MLILDCNTRHVRTILVIGVLLYFELCFYFKILTLKALAQGDICDQLPDGTVPEWGCDAYTVCIGGDAVYVDCAANGQVYNLEIRECDE